MKVAVISNDTNETRGLKGSYTRKEMLDNPRGPYDPGMCWLQNDSGLIHGLEADYYNCIPGGGTGWRHRNEGEGKVSPGDMEQRIKILGEYDVIFTMTPFLNEKIRDDQLYVYYEVEPWVISDSSSGWNSGVARKKDGSVVIVEDQSQYIGPKFTLGDLYTEKIGHAGEGHDRNERPDDFPLEWLSTPELDPREDTIYDAFCNPFIPLHEYSDNFIQKLANIDYHPNNLTPEFNIPFPLRWCIDTIRGYCKDDYIKIKQKKRPKIWVSCRTIKFHTSRVNDRHKMGFPKDTSMFSGDYDYLWERVIDFPHDEYFEAAGECKYMINLDDVFTPGCIFADAACLGIIAFGRKGKQYFDLLYPPYCQVETLDDCYRKIEELQNNTNLYNDIVNHIEKQLRYIDHRNTLDFFE